MAPGGSGRRQISRFARLAFQIAPPSIVFVPWAAGLNAHAFDNPIAAPDLARIRAEAKALAEIRGGVAHAPAPRDGDAGADGVPVWVYVDPSTRYFGEEVEDVVQGDQEASIHRGSVALVKRGEEWTSAERVRPADKSKWMQEKLCGESRDSRLLPLSLDPSTGFRQGALKGAVRSMKQAAESDGFLFEMSRAALEMARGVAAAGYEFGTYHKYWA